MHYVVVYYILGGDLIMTEKEMKPKSFRITEETAEKFKEISNGIGGNQQETLAKLIEAYEFQQGKAVLTEKKADIEKFEKLISCVTRMYMDSLEENQNITEIVRTEFQALLQSKDSTIQSLQKQLAESKESRKRAEENESSMQSQLDSLRNELVRTNEEFENHRLSMGKMLSDKDSLNKALTDSCNALKMQIKDAEALKAQLVEFDSLKSQIGQLKAELEHKDLEFEKNVLELERQKQNEIAGLKEKHISEIEHYQNLYRELLEQKKTSVRKKKTDTVTQDA